MTIATKFFEILTVLLKCDSFLAADRVVPGLARIQANLCIREKFGFQKHVERLVTAASTIQSIIII